MTRNKIRLQRERQRCPDCPDPTTTKPPVAKVDLLQQEGQTLWNRSIFSVGQQLDTMIGYVALDVPGNPIKGLRVLRDKLDGLLKVYADEDPSQSAAARLPADEVRLNARFEQISTDTKAYKETGKLLEEHLRRVREVYLEEAQKN
jgi:hypothetical protein